MRKIVAVFLIFLAFNQASAANLPVTPKSPYDVVAPSMYGDPAASDRVLGQIYYDIEAGGYKGINKLGSVDILSVSTGNPVISSGIEKVNRVNVTTVCTSTPCTIASQSGSWVSSVTRSAAGVYRININSGVFSAAPTCTVYGYSGSVTNSLSSSTGTAPTTTTFDFQFVKANANTTGEDSSFGVICMGPQ